MARHRPSTPTAAALPSPSRVGTVLACTFTLLAVPLSAQTPGREPAVLELVPGARAMGLGFAPAMSSNDPDIVFAHPALVGQTRGMQAGFTHFGGEATAFNLAAATDWYGGGVAVSVSTLSYSADVPGARSSGLDDFLRPAGGGTAVAEQAVSVTYGRQLFGVNLGVSGRLYDQRFGEDRSLREAFDVGVAQRLGPVQAALSVRNLGSDDALPREVALGAGGYGQPLGPLDVGIALQAVYRDDESFTVGGGLEFGYWPIRGRTFVGRVGLRNVPEGEASPVTFGGSFWGDSLVLDYAFQGVDGLDGIHRVSVGWR